MRKGKRAIIAFSILTAFFAILLIAAIIGASIANYNSAALNAYFDVLPYKLVQVGEDEVLDTEYFKSSFITKGGNYDDEALWDYDLRVTEQIVNEGSVLLWNNDKALPLASESAVSCFSNTSVNMVFTGTGSGSINVSSAVTLREGLEKYKFKVNEKLWDFYATGTGSKSKGYGLLQKGSSGISTNEALYTKEVPWSVIMSDSNVAGSFTSYGDAAIFVLGRSGGEGGDLANKAPSGDSNFDTIGGDYLQLSNVEKTVLDNLMEQKSSGVFKKIILIINSANAMQMDLIAQYASVIDACMWVGQPGAGGAPGIAKLLCGEANPSGGLVNVYCYDNDSSPAMMNFYLNRYANASGYSLDATQTAYTVYQEGVYIGYKYYETRYEDKVLGRGNAGDFTYSDVVAFPFGFGKSYSTFSFSDYGVTKNSGGDYEVSVKVTNTGEYKGRHVAQIYLQKPYVQYDINNKIEKAAIELVGYAKTGILEPNANETLKIIVDDQDFKSYDSYGAKTYIRQAGAHYLSVGNDAHDALNNVLAAKYAAGISVNRALMTDSLGNQTNGNASLAHKIDFAELDTTTYSKSIHTNVEIVNQFDFADINRYENNGGQTVKYLTRNDWTGTFPVAAPTLNLNNGMVTMLTHKRDLKPTEDDANKFFESHGEITYGSKDTSWSLIQMKGLPYNAPEWDELLDQMTWDEQAELCSNGYHTTAMVESINKPATRDENGPLGISVTFSASKARRSMGWPCEPTRAATFNKALSELFGKCLGEDMLHAGVTGLWGYGLNIHRTPYSGRNFEYYSEDSFLSGEVCAIETLGAQSKGCFIMVKHFAANDSETQRHGNNEWMSEQTLREIYLYPFEKEFTKGKAWATMTSYNRLGNEWTGGCYALLNQVLRGEWGYMGFACSDYAGQSRAYDYYQNVYIGIQAGCDTYDANFHKDEYDGFQNNKKIQYCLRISSKRICYAIMNTAIMNGISSSTKVVAINTWWQNALIAAQAGVGGVTAIFAGLLALSIVRKVKRRKEVSGE